MLGRLRDPGPEPFALCNCVPPRYRKILLVPVRHGLGGRLHRQSVALNRRSLSRPRIEMLATEPWPGTRRSRRQDASMLAGDPVIWLPSTGGAGSYARPGAGGADGASVRGPERVPARADEEEGVTGRHPADTSVGEPGLPSCGPGMAALGQRDGRGHDRAQRPATVPAVKRFPATPDLVCPIVNC